MLRTVLGVMAGAVLVGGLSLLAPLPGVAGDYGRYEGYGSFGYGYGGTEYVRRDGNVSYNAYNSYDGYRRGLGYWDRPGDGYRYGYGYGRGYGRYGDHDRDDYRDDRDDRRGYGYGYRNRDGYGSGDRSRWCAERFRSYDPRSGSYIGYDGYRHYCG